MHVCACVCVRVCVCVCVCVCVYVCVGVCVHRVRGVSSRSTQTFAKGTAGGRIIATLMHADAADVYTHSGTFPPLSPKLNVGE